MAWRLRGTSVCVVNGLFGSSEQLIEIACAKQAVVVYGVPKLRDFALAAPIAKGVAAYPQVFGRFVYPQKLIQLRHLSTHC